MVKWLDYDPIAVVVLVVGLAALASLVLRFRGYEVPNAGSNRCVFATARVTLLVCSCEARSPRPARDLGHNRTGSIFRLGACSSVEEGLRSHNRDISVAEIASA
jgi:hypothetical protein